MTKNILFALFIALALIGTNARAAGVSGAKIKKCQDAAGRWHYGDSAADQCRQSKIIEINNQGIETKEIAAPLTAEELKQRELNKASIEAAKKQGEEQARQDQLLLATYGHEDDISFVRDRKIADIEGQIRSSQQTVTSLQNALKRHQAQAADEQRGGKASEATTKQIANIQAQIAKHEEYIAQKKKEEDAIRAQAEKDTLRYRQLKKSQSAAVAAGTPAPATAK